MKLKLYLVEHRIKTQDFAHRLGCSRTYLSEIMHGKKRASLTLARLIQVLTDDKVKAEDVISEYKGKEFPKVE